TRAGRGRVCRQDDAGLRVAVEDGVTVRVSILVRAVKDARATVVVSDEAFDHVRFLIVLPYEDAVAAVVVGQAILEGPQAMAKLGPLESAGVHVALDTHGDTSQGGVPLERPQ